MTDIAAPRAVVPAGIQLSLDTVVEICDLVGADTISIINREVTYTRKGAVPHVLRGEIGNWLVPEGTGFWRIVPEPHWHPAALAELRNVAWVTSALEFD